MNACDSLRIHIYCSYRLELLVAELIDTFVNKSANETDPRLRAIIAVLKTISIESRKHAEILNHIASVYGLFKEVDNCSLYIGAPWNKLDQILGELHSGKYIGLRDFIERQAWFESAIGEETYHKLLMPLLREGLKEGCVDEESVDILSEIFDKITSDEKWHEKVLLKVLALTN